MKKFIDKLKTNLVAVWIAIISFPSKVLAQPPKYLYDMQLNMQTFYGIERPSDIEILEPTESIIDIIIKSAPRLLTLITFVVGIVCFIKIRKIEDKEEKNKKIKRTVIVIAILVVILVATFVISALLLGK